MDIDLYMKLVNATSNKNPPIKKTDSDSEKEISELTDFLIEKEKLNFQEGLESLASQEAKMRQEIREAFQNFSKSYENGFTAIRDALAEYGETFPTVSEENLQAMSDPDTAIKAIEEGQHPYQILGFSFDTLLRFYTILGTFLLKEDFEKMRDGFIFLTSLSPNTAEFWTGLAIAWTRLEDYPNAENTYLQSLELNSSLADTYFGYLHILAKQKRIPEAYQLCDRGIAFAETYPDEPRHADLIAQLTEAKNMLTKLS